MNPCDYAAQVRERSKALCNCARCVYEETLPKVQRIVAAQAAREAQQLAAQQVEKIRRVR